MYVLVIWFLTLLTDEGLARLKKREKLKRNVYSQSKMQASQWKRHSDQGVSVQLFYDGLPDEHKLIYEHSSLYLAR